MNSINKLMLASSLVAFTFASGVASAVTLTNLDKADATVSVAVGTNHETVTLKENASYDSKGKDATLTFGKEKPIAAKAGDKLVIKGGKIEADTDAKAEVKTMAPAAAATTDIKSDVKPETAAPSAGLVKSEVKTELKK